MGKYKHNNTLARSSLSVGTNGCLLLYDAHIIVVVELVQTEAMQVGETNQVILIVQKEIEHQAVREVVEVDFVQEDAVEVVVLDSFHAVVH